MADQDFCVDYAKSDRSTCTGSKKKIPKGALRMGKMVQAPNFDGKIPKWYLFGEFFKKGTMGLVAVDQIKGFDNIRNADQQRIMQKLGLATGTAMEDEGDGDSDENEEEEEEEAPKSKRKAPAKGKGKKKADSDDDESEEEEKPKRKRAVPKRGRAKKDESDDDEEEESEEESKSKRGKAKAKAKPKGRGKKKADSDDEEEEEEDEPKSKRGKAKAAPKARGKKKRDEEEDEEAEQEKPEPASKKQKAQTPEELADEAYAKENKYLWGVKDKLKDVKTAELKGLLEANGCVSKGGRDDLINRVADILAYGVGPKCDGKDCDGSRLYFSTAERAWKCPAKLAWGRCLTTKKLEEVTTEEPEIPETDHDYLSEYEFKPRERVLRRVQEVSAEEKKKALLGTVVAVFLTPNEALEKKILEYGGTIKSRVTKEVTHLIAKEEEYDPDQKGKTQTAQKYEIPIVPPTYFESIIESGVFQDSSKVRLDKDSDRPAKSEDEKRKRIVKGGYAVDPECGLELMDVHVHKNGEDGYDVMMNLADVQTGRNSYYALQVIVEDKDKGNGVWLWRKWGRVATDIGSNKLDEYDDVEDAVAMFEKLYDEKTGNSWAETGPRSKRHNFEKKPKLMFPIDIQYTDEDTTKKIKGSLSNSGSKLDPRVQDLIRLIFDIKLMESDLIEMQFDLKKMPLGNLTKEHIRRGYDVLTQINDALTDPAEDDREQQQTLMQLTNQFYSIIPHDFGLKAPQMITSLEVLKAKIKMMESLMEIEIAAQILKSDGGEASTAKSEIDQKYEALHTDLQPLEKDSDEFHMVEEYITNTRVAGTNHWPKLTVSELFAVRREGEEERFDTSKHLGNRFLLFHGSRISNYGGILSQGLRIAPPSAPKSGYRFGKGIYFADVIAKSANYCRSTGSDYMLIMLCDVSMGKVYETKQDQYMEKPQPGFDSTKAVGQYQPTIEKTVLDGVQVPCGKPKDTKTKSSCDVNEHIVYDISQVTIRYLMKLHHPSS